MLREPSAVRACACGSAALSCANMRRGQGEVCALAVAAALCVGSAGCGGLLAPLDEDGADAETSGDASSRDAFDDVSSVIFVGFDATVPTPEASVSLDATFVPPDAGADVSVDALADVAPDAPLLDAPSDARPMDAANEGIERDPDAAGDASIDAPADAPTDGPMDAFVDGPTDAAPDSACSAVDGATACTVEYGDFVPFTCNSSSDQFINAGFIGGEAAVVSTPITLTALGVIGSPSMPGNITAILALYSDAGGVPSALLARTESTLLHPGNISIPVTAPVALSAGIYWIMAEYNASAHICIDSASTNTLVFTNIDAYGTVPSFFDGTLTTLHGYEDLNYYLVGTE